MIGEEKTEKLGEGVQLRIVHDAKDGRHVKARVEKLDGETVREEGIWHTIGVSFDPSEVLSVSVLGSKAALINGQRVEIRGTSIIVIKG